MILVTGATGLVGGNLLWQLLQQNERVVAIRRLTSNLNSLRDIFRFYTDDPQVFLDRIDWKIADVLDSESLFTAMENMRIVYHCAAIVSLGNQTKLMTETNVTGTRNVVETALRCGVDKLCFVSSISACGSVSKGQIIDENTVWTDYPNRSEYSRSKYYSEQEVWKGIQKGLNAVIVNPGVILGVSGNNTGSSQLFSQVQNGLIFYTTGGSGYVDVRDVVRAMIALTESKTSGERFILISENCSLKQVLSWMADGFETKRPYIGIGKPLFLFAGMIAEFFGKLLRFQPIIDRSFARTATNRKFYSNKKVKETIGFEFIPVKKCINDICRFRYR